MEMEVAMGVVMEVEMATVMAMVIQQCEVIVGHSHLMNKYTMRAVHSCGGAISSKSISIANLLAYSSSITS